MQSPIKFAVVGAVCLLVGGVAGSLPGRFEIRSLEQQLEEALEASSGGRGMGQELTSFIVRQAGRESSSEMDMPGSDSPEDGLEVTDEPVVTPSQDDEDDLSIQIGDDSWEEEEGSMEDRMDVARHALELRRTQALAALEQEGDLDDQQMEDFESTLDEMNRSIREMTEEMVDQLNDGEEPTRRQMMKFAADGLDVFIEADETLSEILDADQLENVPEESLDPFSYVDPSLLDLLQEMDR